MRVLVEPITLNLPARELDRVSSLAPLVRVARQLLEQLDHPIAVPVASRHRPVVLEPLEQVAPAQLERAGRIAPGLSLELTHVDPQLRAFG